MRWKLDSHATSRGHRRDDHPRALAARGITLVAASIAVLAWAASPAHASFPGTNGKIAFHTDRNGNLEIYSMNADGTSQTRLTNNSALDANPAWSADGTTIAFTSSRDGNNEIYKMNADGTGQTRLTNNAVDDVQAVWSPDGTKIAFATNRDGNFEIYTMNADGTVPTRLTNNAALDKQPAWSPDGARIAFATNRDGHFEIYTMNSNGTSPTRTTNMGPPPNSTKPSWSPDGNNIAFENDGLDYEVWLIPSDGSATIGTNVTNTTSAIADREPGWSPNNLRIAFATDRDGNFEIYTMNVNGTVLVRLTTNSGIDQAPDWQPATQNYARPRSATPSRLALVPAYKVCPQPTPGAPNSKHKGALTTPSCNPPLPESNYLTLGTPDFNGQVANGVGYLEMKAFCNGGAAGEVPPCSTTAGEQLDGKVTISQTDVRCRAATGSCPNGVLGDYAGNLLATLSARITDQNSGGNGSATLQDVPVSFFISCTPTGASTIGSTCSSTTSFDALLGGATVIAEGKRAIWSLDGLKIYDGGADGVASTLGDNTLFATHGLFFP